MVMWLVLGASWIFAVIKTNIDTSFCLGVFECPDYNTTHTTLSIEKKHCHLFTFRRRCRFFTGTALNNHLHGTYCKVVHTFARFDD